MFSFLRPFRILLLCIVALGIAGCSSPQDLLIGLSQTDANQVMVVLQSQDISATKVAAAAQTGQTSATYTVQVSSSDYNNALKILVDNKLPKMPSADYSTVYAGASGIIPSSTQEKAQYLMALQGEIENMLKVLPGIVQARVVIVLPDPTVIRDPGSPPAQSTASVAVVYNPSDSQGNSPFTPYDIQNLVASAIPELPPNNVTVVMATNSPMKLIDAKKAVPKSVSTAKPAATSTTTTPATPTPAQPSAAAPTATPSSTVPTTTAKIAATPTGDSSGKNDFLLTLFGALAAIGLLFGVLGLMRSISLRAKLTRMEKAVTDEPAPTQVSAGPAPATEATVGAGE